MKLITILLSENVENLGIVGDVVEVKPGFARNFLIPRGIGIEPSEENVAALAARRAEVEVEMKRLRAEIEKTFAKLEGYELTMMRSSNEQGVLFGGVSQHDIAEALREAGIPIDDRAVRIGEQIKRLDSYHVPITLAQDLKTEIKLWVVSDKPQDELDAEDDSELGAVSEPTDDAPAEEAAEEEAAEAR